MFDDLTYEQITDILFRLRVAYWLCFAIAVTVFTGLVASIMCAVYQWGKKKGMEEIEKNAR